jgi:hypothetical protein
MAQPMVKVEPLGSAFQHERPFSTVADSRRSNRCPAFRLIVSRVLAG